MMESFLEKGNISFQALKTLASISTKESASTAVLAIWKMKIFNSAFSVGN